MQTQTDRVLRQRGHLLYLITGKDETGRNAWYYLLVDKPKLTIFLAAFHKPGMELTDYGRIIASGYGDEPPEDTQKEFKDKYGG